MTTQGLSVLGGISAEQFFAEYWQKKPLLVRNALPQVVGLLVPQDIMELAQEEVVTARLLTQQGAQNEQWRVKNSPFTGKDFKKLPPLWTLLVQALDHFSPEVAQLWQQFDFIPQWRRDDIMVSYAPKGGSVGRHYDQYDVFLVQCFGSRRWQLGQYCSPDCELIANQPLRLLPEIDVWFDEVLQPGDLLYVPPTLAHYGVAQDDCLTFSFGFRMPSAAQLLEEFTDELLNGADAIQIPVPDVAARPLQSAGLVAAQDLNLLKQHLMQMMQDPLAFEQAALRLLSESKYPDSLPENESLTLDELKELLQSGATIIREPAVKLLYQQNDSGQVTFWAMGEPLELNESIKPVLKALADGATLDQSSIV
jgi:50S ribosomal protein L16 3-hydroxylase